jgi:hypothetical protein
MELQGPESVLAGWEGDFRELLPHVERIAGDTQLCERLFATRQEALNFGLFAGEVLHPTPERRQLWGASAMALRRAHTEDMVQPPALVLNLIATLGYSDSEIDDAFTALVELDGLVCGRSVLLEDVIRPYDHLLLDTGLVEEHQGHLRFTTRGNNMLALLEAYGRSKNVWRSLAHRDESDSTSSTDK